MKTASMTHAIQYNEGRPNISVLFNTEAGKEIRIVFKKGQVMKEHKAPFPIVVEVFKGQIDFEVLGKTHALKAGDLIAIEEGNVPHELTAVEDSIVRLSLHKGDSTNRVKDAAKK